MQLTGTVHRDVCTFWKRGKLHSFPAEIRAPQAQWLVYQAFKCILGALRLIPGDAADVLIAMNPAALKSNTSVRKGKNNNC